MSFILGVPSVFNKHVFFFYLRPKKKKYICVGVEFGLVKDNGVGFVFLFVTLCCEYVPSCLGVNI